MADWRDPGWLAARLATGMGPKGIALEVGAPVAEVRAFIREHNIKTRNGVRDLVALGPDVLLAALAATGSWVQAASNLRTDYSMLRDALDRLGVPLDDAQGALRRRYARLDDARWLREQYVDKGRTATEIAQLLGCSADAVRRALRRHEIPVRRLRGVSDADLVAAVASASTVAEAAASLQVSVVTLMKHMALRGLGTPSEHVVRQKRPRRPLTAANFGNLRAANKARTVQATTTTVERAQAVLAAGGGTDGHRRVLTARVEHPDLSLAEVAATLGMTKDAYASRLRRALAPMPPLDRCLSDIGAAQVPSA